MYDAIIIGGIPFDLFGRPLGPYRLRTAAEKQGYSVKVIDFASHLTDQELINLLNSLISNKTKVIGISTPWFEHSPTINSWVTNSFFNYLKEKYSQIKIVVGGTKSTVHPILIKYTEWFLSGFSDISFIKLLNFLSDNKKENLKYFKNSSKVNLIDSDNYYQVKNVDDIETIYKIEDNFYEFQPLTLEISRGCIFKCSFCTHPFLGKKNYDYIRSIESISNELKRNYQLFKTTRYFISDDTFNDSIEKIDRVSRAVELSKIPNFEFVSYIKPELLVTNKSMIYSLKSLGLKGAHFGIESFNNKSRKVVGKGMDIEKIIEISKQFYQETKVKIHASFILGLPYDTINDFYNWQEFLIKNKEELFLSWRYNTLGLINPKFGNLYSLIEKNPKQYGYTTIATNNLYLHWKNNNDISSHQCDEISKELNRQSNKFMKIAGWTLGSAWFQNINKYDIEYTTLDKLNLYEIAKINYYKRVILERNALI